MEFTMNTVVLLIIIMIIGLIIIGLIMVWKDSGTNVIDDFLNWVSGGAKKP